MSQNDDENWAHFNVRCEVELREKAEANAKKYGQSLAEWIRRAMQEKLEREEAETGSAKDKLRSLGIGYSDLDEIILERVKEMSKKGLFEQPK